MAGPAEDDGLENLYGLLSEYGVQSQDGVVVESDRERYAFQTPYALLPSLNSHAITDPLTEEGCRPILPIARGLTVTEQLGGVTVTELLTTSDSSFRRRRPLRPGGVGGDGGGAAGWCGLPPLTLWRMCTTPIPPGPTWIWP